ncbi:hypothetical protein F5B20DRAFT_406203 [Whalleya microplaca]|nr:hypothetical protein F5B20DRAFT_406203 [Whalleya microplaca]
MKFIAPILAFSLGVSAAATSKLVARDGVEDALDLLKSVLASAKDVESVLLDYTGGPPVELHGATIDHIKDVRAALFKAEDLPDLPAEALTAIAPLTALVSRTEVTFAQNVAGARLLFGEGGNCEYMHEVVKRLQGAVQEFFEGLGDRLPKNAWVGNNNWHTVTEGNYLFSAASDNLAEGVCINIVNPQQLPDHPEEEPEPEDTENKENADTSESDGVADGAEEVVAGAGLAAVPVSSGVVALAVAFAALLV